MRLTMTYDGSDLFCQSEFVSVFGVHSKRITEDMPPEVHAAALLVANWANAQETTLRTAIESHETAANIRREINRLEAKERAVLGRS